MSEDLLELLNEVKARCEGERPLRSLDVCAKLSEEFREATVRLYIRDEEVAEVLRDIEILRGVLSEAVLRLGAAGWSVSKEFGSFLSDPRRHLRKKLVMYMSRLIRGTMGFEEYLDKARAAVTTSLRTNMRTLYQSWVFASILLNLGKLGARLIYPEHGFIPLERSGKQRTGTIPPNVVISVDGFGELSFFIEAPRPVGWEDTEDLKKAWSLYTSLRPDIMVYGGMKLNIFDPGQGAWPPIVRPSVIVECKELSDWFARVRDIKGRFAKPLTVEEWMSKWFSGLQAGLAEILGIERASLGKMVEERRGIRLTEPQIVALYKKVYRPDEMFLVSKPRLPEPVVKDLESWGIKVLDGVSIGCSDCLEDLSANLLKYAEQTSGDPLDELLRTLRTRGTQISRARLLEAVRDFVLKRLDEFLDELRQKQ